MAEQVEGEGARVGCSGAVALFYGHQFRAGFDRYKFSSLGIFAL